MCSPSSVEHGKSHEKERDGPDYGGSLAGSVYASGQVEGLCAEEPIAAILLERIDCCTDDRTADFIYIHIDMCRATSQFLYCSADKFAALTDSAGLRRYIRSATADFVEGSDDDSAIDCARDRDCHRKFAIQHGAYLGTQDFAAGLDLLERER